MSPPEARDSSHSRLLFPGVVIALAAVIAVGVGSRESIDGGNGGSSRDAGAAVETSATAPASNDASSDSAAISKTRQRQADLTANATAAANETIKGLVANRTLAQQYPAHGKLVNRKTIAAKLKAQTAGSLLFAPSGTVPAAANSSLAESPCLQGDSAQIQAADFANRPTDPNIVYARAASAPVSGGTTETQNYYRFTLAAGSECNLFFGSESNIEILGPVGTVVSYALQTIDAGNVRTSNTQEIPFDFDQPNHAYTVPNQIDPADFPPTSSRVHIRLDPSVDVLLRNGFCLYCDLRGSRLTGYNLGTVNVHNSDFSGATIYNTDFGEQSDLRNTRWGEYNGTGAILAHANFKLSEFAGSRFSGAQLVNTAFADSEFSGVSFDHMMIDATCSFTDISWTGGNISFTDVSLAYPGPILNGDGQASWKDLNFSNSTLVVDADSAAALKGGEVTNVHLNQTFFLGIPPDLSGSSWSDSEIVESALNAAELDRARLSALNLSFTDFSHTSMIGADLSGSTANGAIFSSAKIQNGSLAQGLFGQGADGTQAPAIFDQADIRAADFTGADLRGTSFRKAYVFTGTSDPRFGEAHLERAVFEESLIGGAKFDNAVLDDASFRFAQCIACVFTGTTTSLKRVDFRDSYLFGSDLTSADLTNANFGNADFVTAQNSTWIFVAGIGAAPPAIPYEARSMDNVRYGSVTLCPNGTPPAGSCAGAKGNPSKPPPRPPKCVSAGGLLCSLTINTIAGTGVAGYSEAAGSKLATQSQFNQPKGVVSYQGKNKDRHLVLVADTENNVVRSIDLVTNSVSVFAGTPKVAGFDGDGGPASSAKLNSPQGLAVDSEGAVLIADTGNNRIRKVQPDGSIVTIAGTGAVGAGGDGGFSVDAQLAGPKGVGVSCAKSECLIFVADTGNNKVRVISGNVIDTVAGSGQAGKSGDGGQATRAQLNKPQSVATDSKGNLYLADTGNDEVRRVSPSGVISTYKPDLVDLHSKPPVQQLKASGVFVDAQNYIYLSAAGSNQVSRWNIQGGNAPGLVANQGGTAGFSGDGGSSLAAQLASPAAVSATPEGQIIVADTANNRIRMMTPS